MPQKLGHDKFYVHEKILRSRNCRRKFIKNLLPEKRKKKRTFKPNNSDLNRDWKITKILLDVANAFSEITLLFYQEKCAQKCSQLTLWSSVFNTSEYCRVNKGFIKQGFSYVMLVDFHSDRIEGEFVIYRQCAGGNYFISLSKFWMDYICKN